MPGAVVLAAIAGAALATLPVAAGLWAAVLGALAGAVVGGALAERLKGFSPWSLALLAFLAPVFTMPVAPGADMAMHAALARGLLSGTLSPAWPSVHVAAYPRGFSALVAFFWPLGPARAGLLAAAASYLVFWYGLSALLQWMRVPAARTVAAVALFLSKSPQAFFSWGGNPTALALGLAFFAVAQESATLAALCLAGSAAVHPMGALAGALPLALRWQKPRVPLVAATALCAVLGALALAGPQLSARELSWIRDYGLRHEHGSIALLGDPANIATGLAAAVLVWRRRFRLVVRSAVAIVVLFALFLVLPYAGLYPVRFGPLLLVAAAPLWAEAAAARIPLFAAVALLVAAPFHLRWYQESTPMATAHDLDALACLDRSTPGDAVIDGAYGDATQWIPALTGRKVTHPHEHVSLFDETDAALERLPAPGFRFNGERMRYGEALPPARGAALCGGALLRLQ
ncbi:MAG TPA: hypothetical protein VI356_04520 [Myxococcales bacterium]